MEIECPYCGNEQELCQDDGHGSIDGEYYEEDCDSCFKTFVFYPSIIYDFSTHTADCLNGSPHNIKITDNINTITESCRDCSYRKNTWK